MYSQWKSNLSDVSSVTTTDRTLKAVEYYLHVCILPALIVFGVMGNIANLYIFTRPSLYRSCSIYFLAGAINGLLLLLFGTTTRWLGHAFENLDATHFSIFFCRLRVYLINIIYDLAPYFIACVTVDRYCSSSANVNTRRLSARPRLAYAVIFTIVAVTSLAFIHTLTNHAIIDSLCQSAPRLYTRFLSSFATVYYFTAVIIILVFGFGTAYNVRAQRRRIQPLTIRMTKTDRRQQRSDGQLLLIVLVHVACYSVLAMPYHVLLILSAVDPTVLRNATFLFIQSVAVIALNVSQAVSKGCFLLATSDNKCSKDLIKLLHHSLRTTVPLISAVSEREGESI